MPCTKGRLIVLDGGPSIRSSMSLLLAEIGHRVRCVQDKFSALRELHSELPEILPSDLDKPGMFGFELLSVLRWRFPAILAIAMRAHSPATTFPLALPPTLSVKKATAWVLCCR